MGDKILVKSVNLIRNEFYQIEYYNETKEYYGVINIQKEEIEKARVYFKWQLKTR